ncbi:MAG: hypothetical protein R6X02_02045 [Enhygromyxa sp.]
MPIRALLVWMTASAVWGGCVSSSVAIEPAQEPEADTPTVVTEAEPARTPRSNPTSDGPTTDEGPSAFQPAPGSAGLPEECDEYLTLYERCEEQLEPQIMAGERRFAHAERAWLEQLADTPEAASLPGACSNMLDALRSDCPGGS